MKLSQKLADSRPLIVPASGPATIGALSHLECRLRSQAGVTKAGDGVVSQWDDVSGKTISMIAPDLELSAGPRYTTDNGPNGKPWLDFGTDWNGLLYRDPALPLNGPYTIFAVIKTGNVAWAIMNGKLSVNGQWIRANATRQIIHNGVDTGADGPRVDNTWEIWTAKYDGSQTTLKINNVSKSLTSAPTSLVAPNGYLVFGGYLTGTTLTAASWNFGGMTDFVAVSNALSSTDEAMAYAELATEYGF